MILVCTGSRTWTDELVLRNHLYDFLNTNDVDLVRVGDAKGADRLVRDFCSMQSIPFKTFVANWNRYGGSAGPIRNAAMMSEEPVPGHLIAFRMFGTSRGTDNCMTIAKMMGVPITLVNQPGFVK